MSATSRVVRPKRSGYTAGVHVSVMAATVGLLVACGGPGPTSQDAASDRALPRWNCPTEWVPTLRGGCGPAVLLCGPEGGAIEGACSSVDLSRPRTVMDPPLGDGGGVDAVGSTFYRAADGGIAGGWPTERSAPDAGPPTCPPGWRRESDGTCDPAFRADCPGGSAALPGGTCTTTGTSDCPSGEYADPGAEAMGATIVRVGVGGDDTTADGSAARPFATVTAAMARAGAGGWVLVGAGSWTQRLSATASVHILGLCAAHTTLRAETAVDPVVAASGASTWLDVRGVTMTGGAPGARASDGARLTLVSVRVESVAMHGVQSTGAGSRVEARDVAIRAVRAGSDGMFGRGLNAEAGGSISARRVSVDTAIGRGANASTAPSLIDLQDVVVRNIAADPAVGAGFGISAIGGARATLDRVAVATVTGIGIMSGSNASVVTAQDLSVRGTRALRANSLAAGIAVGSTGSIAAERASLRDTCCAGILATQQRSRATLRDSVIVDVADVSNGQSGFGAQATDGAVVELVGTRVVRAISQGLDALGAGSAIVLDGVVVESTRARDDGSAGMGIEVAAGASLNARNVLVRDNALAGVLIDGAETTATVTDGVVLGRASPSLAGRGVSVQNGAHASFARVRVDDNASVGLYAAAEGTRVTLRDVGVFGTRSGANGLGGHGIDCVSGAVVDARRVVLAGNHEAAMAVALGRATVIGTDILVAGVTASALGSGLGIASAGRGVVTLSAVSVIDAMGAAVVSVPLEIDGAGLGDAQVELNDVYVARVRSSPVRYVNGAPIDRTVAYGLHVAGSCGLRASRAVIDRGGYGFFMDRATLSLDTVVLTRMLDAAGATSVGSGAASLVLSGDVRYDNAIDEVLRDLTLPSATTLPPPTPIGM